MRPHFLIILRSGKEYIRRWYGLPYKLGRKVGNIYLHKIMEDDPQRLHDHPYLFTISIVLKGGYYETTPRDRFDNRSVDNRPWVTRWHGPGSIIFRGRLYPHRLSLLSMSGDTITKRHCWTLFICGPVRQDWGFHTSQGWISHKRITEIKDGRSQITVEGEELMR